jgi:hypothetical protein
MDNVAISAPGYRSVVPSYRLILRLLAVAWRSALSLLADHDIALNTRLVVVHFGSDRHLRRDESYPSGIRFVPGDSIRFHVAFILAK